MATKNTAKDNTNQSGDWDVLDVVLSIVAGLITYTVLAFGAGFVYGVSAYVGIPLVIGVFAYFAYIIGEHVRHTAFEYVAE